MPIVLSIFAVSIPILIYAAPHFGQKKIISNLDLNLPFWLYLLQIIIGIAIFITLRKDFKDWFKNLISKAYKLIPTLLVALLAVSVCIFWIEPRHRVQSDESIFLSTAQNMYANQVAGSCNEGEFTKNGHLDCQKNVHNFKTKGEPFLYSLLIPILGHDLRWVFPLHLFLLLATVFMLFFAVKAWTANDNLAFLTVAIFAAQPTTLFQFRAASVEPLYTFLFAFSIFAWKWAWDKNTIKHWILLALILAFFAQTRQETVFCLAAFIVPSFFRMKRDDFAQFLLTISIFCIPVLLTISYYQGYEFQGGEFSAHGHFFENLKQAWNISITPLNKEGLLRNPFLSWFSVLTVIGIISLFALKQKNFLIFFALYFPQIFMILENVSGDMSIEINQRYTLVAFPAMAFFCAFALEKASLLMPKKQFAFALICAGLVWAGTLRYSESFKTNIMYNRNHLTTEEVEILKWVDKNPIEERIFIYARPWHFIGIGMNSIHYNSLSKSRLKELMQKYKGNVFYIRGLDCWDSKTYHKKAVETRFATVCDSFEENYPMDVVYSTVITNNYRVTIGKLK